MSVAHEALSRWHSTRVAAGDPGEPDSSATDHGAMVRRAPSVPSVTSTIARARPSTTTVSGRAPSVTVSGAALRFTHDDSSSGSSVTRGIIGAIVSSRLTPARKGL